MNFYDRAINLHKKIGLVDAHIDLAPEVFERRQKGESHVIERSYLENFKKGNLRIITAVVFIDTVHVPELALKLALMQIEALYDDVSECPELTIASTKAQLQAGLDAGKIVILISMEGLEPIGKDLKLLSTFRRLGVTGAGLVWSRRNYIGDGCHFKAIREGTTGGLTGFGLEVLEEIERLGMFADVSHMNDAGFWDVVKFAKKPFIASHSNNRNVYDMPRNLTDEMALALAEKGGVIGINGVDIIVCDETLDRQTKFKILCDHIEHLVNLIGAKHVGYGFDMCDNSGLSSLPYSHELIFDHDVIKNHGDIVNIAAELLSRGMSQTDVEYVVGRSFKEFYLNIMV